MKTHLVIFKAFSDETRLRILFLLAIRELCVCELVAVLDMPQGKISRHLALLKYADIVTDRRDGTWVYYSLRPGESDPLKRLTPYLRSGELDSEMIQADRMRLDTLTDVGRICVPNPAHVPPASRN